jgi:hypothetical protein
MPSVRHSWCERLAAGAETDGALAQHHAVATAAMPPADAVSLAVLVAL